MKRGRGSGPAAAAGVLALVLALPGCASRGPLEQIPESTPLDRAIAPQETWLSLGSRLLQAGEYDLAQDAFERSMLVDGVSAEAVTGAGMAASRLGLATMAAEYFETAQKLAPNSVVANNNLGVVLMRLGRYYAARQAFRAAFALSDGRNELAMRNLRLADIAIAGIEAGQTWVDPTVNVQLRRLGSSEFELYGFEEPVVDTDAGDGDDAAAAPAAASPAVPTPAAVTTAPPAAAGAAAVPPPT